MKNFGLTSKIVTLGILRLPNASLVYGLPSAMRWDVLLFLWTITSTCPACQLREPQCPCDDRVLHMGKTLSVVEIYTILLTVFNTTSLDGGVAECGIRTSRRLRLKLILFRLELRNV